MAVSMKELGIDCMSPEDRLSLVQEIWDSLADDAQAVPLTEAQRQDLDAGWPHTRPTPRPAHRGKRSRHAC